MPNTTKSLRTAILLFVLISITVVSIPAQAHWGGCCSDKDWHGWSNTDWPDQYQLTVDQLTKVKEIRVELSKSVAPLVEKLRTARSEYATAETAAEPDADKLKSIRRSISGLEEKIDNLRIDANASINKVLSKTQRTYVTEHSNCDWWDMDNCMSSHYSTTATTHSGSTGCGWNCR